MESWITSGLIGGLSAFVVGAIFTGAAKRKTTNGKLKHGLIILILALACLAFSLFSVWVFFYEENIYEQTSDLIAVCGLFFGFGIAALACFAEFLKVRGSFDADGIEFHTPWTGSKKENWDDLVSAKFNSSMCWYSLKFKSGKKVRLSSYLLGHGEVLAILKERGYSF